MLVRLFACLYCFRINFSALDVLWSAVFDDFFANIICLALIATYDCQR